MEAPPIHGGLIGATSDNIIFCLGSLIYPKDMLKCFHPSISDKEIKNIRKWVKKQNGKGKEIIQIYHFLYRFSLIKLNKWISNPSLTKLSWYYFNNEGYDRMAHSKTMRKYSEAYIEAAN